MPEIKVLSGTHVIPLERKDQVAELVERFLRGLPDLGAAAAE